MIWGLLIATSAIALLLMAVGGNTLGRYHGWFVKTKSPEELSNLLSPAYRVHTPAGRGPWPMMLLFSGCDGPKDNMERWAQALNAQGWAAMVVDSHGPRGYDDLQIWRLICAGQLLPGAERAGDVAVAIADARKLPFVDPGRIALLGASHGGWSILDMFSLLGRGKRPYSLSRWPEGVSRNGAKGVLGAVLLYPYCGPGSQVWRHGWTQDVPMLFLLVEDDTIANEDACLDVIRRMEARGVDVETHVLKGVTHGFDQQDKNALSTLGFSPRASAEAARITTDFLGRVSRGYE